MPPASLLLLLSLLALAALLPHANASSDPIWPKWGRTGDNVGNTLAAGPTVNTGSCASIIELGGDSTPTPASPVFGISDFTSNTMYGVSGDTIFAVNTTSFTLRWGYDTNEIENDEPVMSQLLTSTLGHVWFGGASAIGRLYDGAEHATAPTAEIFSTNNTIAIGGPAISNDETIVFFGTHSGELWALDALSTPITMRWRFSVYQNVTATAELDGASINLPVPPQEPEPDSIHILMVPAVDSQSGLVYFSYLNVLVGLTPSTGKIAALSTFELPDGLALTGGLLISHQTEALFVVANPIDGRGSGDDVTPGIVRFDRKTGESSWLIDVPGHAGPLALSPAEDFLVSSSTDQHLYFVSIDTREVARVDTNGVVAGATLIDGNGLVYASSNDGFLYVFSLATLKLLTKWYSPGIGLQSSPVLGQAGWLYTSGFGILQVIRHGSCSTPHKPHTALFWLVVSVGSIFVAFGFLSLVIGVFFCLRQRRLRLKAQYRQIQDRAYYQDDEYDDEEHDNNRQVGDAQ